MLTVPNKFPAIDPGNQRLALIGETPTEDDITAMEPFVGMSGRFLAALMSKSGLAIQCCFKGNICQVKPPANRLEAFKWNGEELTQGKEQLIKDLSIFKPNIIIALGNLPLKWLKDPDTNHELKPARFKYKVSSWRGSLFTAQGYKAISTFHPTYALRDYKVTPLLQFDLKRAISQSHTHELNLPKRHLQTTLTYQGIIEALQTIRKEKCPVALDIEGGLYSMSCISFASCANVAFTIPFIRKDGTSVWTEKEECYIMRELALTLEDVSIPKILQNAMYDTFVLQYSYDIVVRNVVDDTMIKHWALYAELRKSLALQTSIYTLEPYYKHERLQETEQEEE